MTKRTKQEIQAEIAALESELSSLSWTPGVGDRVVMTGTVVNGHDRLPCIKLDGYGDSIWAMPLSALRPAPCEPEGRVDWQNVSDGLVTTAPAVCAPQPDAEPTGSIKNATLTETIFRVRNAGLGAIADRLEELARTGYGSNMASDALYMVNDLKHTAIAFGVAKDDTKEQCRIAMHEAEDKLEKAIIFGKQPDAEPVGYLCQMENDVYPNLPRFGPFYSLIENAKDYIRRNGEGWTLRPMYDHPAPEPAKLAGEPAGEIIGYAVERIKPEIANLTKYGAVHTTREQAETALSRIYHNSDESEYRVVPVYVGSAPPVTAPLTVAPVSVVEEIHHAKREAFGAHHKCGESGCTETAAAWSRKCAKELDAALAKIVTLPEPSEWAKQEASTADYRPTTMLEVAAAFIRRYNDYAALLQAHVAEPVAEGGK